MFKTSISLRDGTQTENTTPDQSVPRSKGNEGILPIRQNWSLVIKCSLASYPRHPFEGILPFSRKYSQHIISPANGVEYKIEGWLKRNLYYITGLGSKIWNKFFKVFIVWLVQFLKKKMQ